MGTIALANVELFDPEPEPITATGNLGTAPYFAPATLLSSDKVLLAGGSNGTIALANVGTP